MTYDFNKMKFAVISLFLVDLHEKNGELLHFEILYFYFMNLVQFNLYTQAKVA